jgi:dipeptidyl aminopeptidase/acylaminoacyl peptidase
MPGRSSLVALALLLPCSPSRGPALRAEAPARTHDITPDDYFTLATPFEVALSPDGKYAAYTEGRWRESSDDRKPDLWVAPTQTGTLRRVTFDRAGDRSPVWHPDGQHLYFAGARKHAGATRPPYDGKTQVWRVGLEGGRPLAITRAEGGIQSFKLAHDGRTLYYLTETERTEGPWRKLRGQFKGLQYGHGVHKCSQVWKLDLESWRTEKVIDDGRFVHEMALAPDGRRLALITAPDERVIRFEGTSRVDVHDTRTGKTTTLPDRLWRSGAPSPYGWVQGLAWSPRGQALAFNVVFDGYPCEIIVAEWRDGEPATYRLRRPEGVSVRGYGSPLQWSGAADLCFLGEERARVRLYRVSDVRGGTQGPARALTPGDVVLEAFHFDAAAGPRNGERAALILGDPHHLPEVGLLEGPGKVRPLTHLNPQADRWKLPRLSVVSWKGAHGDPVEGILELPFDHRAGQSLPLVVDIHGGPTAASYYRLEFAFYGRTLLPARGYAVLSPNYRGSTGYGDRFLTELVGHENDIEVEDILKGVDDLVARGLADPDRLGVMGWSNGGYLTNCLITKTTRFKAASSGAGIVDTVMEWGANDEPAYAMSLKQGLPWTRPDAYRRTSPTYDLHRVRTPTLIHVGGGDERCPPAQSRMLYRALKEYVGVPAELVVYPGEPHGLMGYKSRKAKMAWDLAWFDRYIRGKAGK